jgi:cell wall-associated NlpC family hydrolase
VGEKLKLGAREKVVQKMTRDGLVEENLSQNTKKRVSSRAKDADFQRGSETESSAGESRASQKARQKKKAAQRSRTQEEKPKPENTSTESTDTGSSGASGSGEAVYSKRVSKLEEKSFRASSRLDDTKEELTRKNTKRKKKLKRQRIYDEETGKAKTRLHFEDELVTTSGHSSLSEKAGAAGKSAGGKVVSTVTGKVHSKIHEVEDENLGVKAAHRTELFAESAGKKAASKLHGKSKTSAQKNKISRLEHRAEKANTKLLFEKSLEETPEIKKSKKRKWQQKREIKKRYAAAYKATGNATAAVNATSTAAMPVTNSSGLLNRLKNGVVKFVGNNKAAIATMLFVGLIGILFISGLGTLGSMIAETGGAVVESTYLSSDEDILAADEAYTQMENALQHQVDTLESTYPGYDEYRYQVDEITHDSYALISYLTAKYGNFKIDDVQSELSRLFSEQFSMSVWDEIEIRTRTVTHTSTDPETGETTTEEEEEEYEWHILNIKVTNQGLDMIAGNELNESQLSLYRIYQSSLGNRSDLFGDRITAGNPASGGMSYDIPSEALSDAKFAAMITEAEKYLGYPYVWGGSSPSTSFDCSGFVSWVINNCGNGWNYGRQTANGLRSICTYVSPSEAKPGDLIFFEKTYNTTGASHVGIYVGNGMMIHCGNPIQYTSIETSYWQQHFLCFGRLP